MIGCASGMPQKLGHSRATARSRSRGVEHRPVHAQPHVAARASARRSRSRRRTRTPSPTRARAGPARPRRRTAPAPPRASAAARRRRPRRRPVELLPEQFGDEPVVADRAVVGGHARVAQQRRALGVRGVAEPEQRGGVAEHVLPDRQRRDPDAAADEQRPPPVLRRAEADAQRPEQPQPVAGAQLAQPPRARADVLEQELEPPVARGGAAPRTRAGGTAARPRPRPSARLAASM